MSDHSISSAIINEPLQSTIIRVANGNVYLTGKRVMPTNEFIAKFYGKKATKTFSHVKSSRLGFVLVYKDGKCDK